MEKHHAEFKRMTIQARKTFGRVRKTLDMRALLKLTKGWNPGDWDWNTLEKRVSPETKGKGKKRPMDWSMMGKMMEQATALERTMQKMRR